MILKNPLFSSLRAASLLGGLLAFVLTSFAVRAELTYGDLRDNGNFFSKQAKAEATRNINELGKRFKKELVIETYAEIPSDLKLGVDLENKAAFNRLFEQWVTRQAKQQAVNGIFILLTKVPAHLHVVVGNETQKRSFTLKDREALVKGMLANLRNKQNDAALLGAVDFVAVTMKEHSVSRSNSSSRGQVPSETEAKSPLSWLVPVLIGLVVVWIGIALVKALLRTGGGGSNAGGGMMPSGLGGGGFFSSLLGGVFGAAAGMWLYDQFSGHHGSANAGEWDDGRGSSNAGDDRADTDYSGSGGDFGGDSDSGGGGFGGDSGGDSGGGDF